MPRENGGFVLGNRSKRDHSKTEMGLRLNLSSFSSNTGVLSLPLKVCIGE
ncbi:hypothetical protein PVAG01_08316 [Phlyctema vagabunda]|uniref:Uncharacterized protein n=1 Tax=Phlyctema vagabunda TaxID=108571 RepID=A0ABR4P920_9HELO